MECYFQNHTQPDQEQIDSISVWDVSGVNSVPWRAEERENGTTGIGQK